MDERGKQLQAQLQFMERNGRALEELVAKMLHVREEQEAFLGVFARGLQDVAAQEESRALAQSLHSLGASSAKLATETHEVMMLRAEPEILQVLAHIQDWGIVPMKRLLEDREKAIKIEQKLQKEFEEKSRSGSAREKEKKSRMLSDQRRRVENVNSLIDLHLRKFEQFRTAKMKKVLAEIVRSNTFYHAKALEVLAAPCAAVHRIASLADTSEEVP